MSKRRMHLIGHMCSGPTMHHNGSWRHPESDVEGVLDPARYERIAQICERGLFDGVFIVDVPMIPDLDEGTQSVIVANGGQLAMLDPILVLAAMARVTKHIGLTAN